MQVIFRVSWNLHPQDDNIRIHARGQGEDFAHVGTVFSGSASTFDYEREVQEGEVVEFALNAARGDNQSEMTPPVAVIVPFSLPVQPVGLSVKVV